MKITGLLVVVGLLTASMYAQNRRDISASGLYDTIPHIVDGASWKTTLTLVNLDTATRKYKIVFHGDDGALKSFAFVGQGSGNTFSGEIPRGGIVFLRLPERLHNSVPDGQNWTVREQIMR